MKNWIVLKDVGKEIGVGEFSFTAPADSFLLIFQHMGHFDTEKIVEIAGANTEIIKYYGLPSTYASGSYQAIQFGIYKINCKKGDTITITYTPNTACNQSNMAWGTYILSVF